MSDLSKEELVEKLAALEHRQWAGWMKYLFARGKMHIDNRFTIDSKWVEQWSRQLETDYKDLPEDEKNRARTEALKILKLLGVSDNE